MVCAVLFVRRKEQGRELWAKNALVPADENKQEALKGLHKRQISASVYLQDIRLMVS
jgi:hypothetical protein